MDFVGFRRLLLTAGLVLEIFAALAAFGVIGGASIADVLGLIAAGLACWIAAALP